MSDGKGTPSKAGDSDRVARKLSSPSSRKGVEQKFASPKSKSPLGLNMSKSPVEKKSPSVSNNKSSEVIVIDDANDQRSSQGQSPKLSSPKEKPVYNWPDATLYQYEVRINLDKKDKGVKRKGKRHEIVILQASAVRY